MGEPRGPETPNWLFESGGQSLTRDDGSFMMLCMARTTVTHVTDDIDGSTDAQEVTFAYAGDEYTIDLGKKNRAAFDKALKPYLSAAKKLPRTPRRKNSSQATSGRRDLTAVREWARSNGIDVSDRGRIAAPVLEQYDATH